MTAGIIDGKKIAGEVREELKTRVKVLKDQGVTPGLGVILVGDNPASKSYVSAKEKACEEIGIYSDDNRLSADTSEKDLLDLIDKMNGDNRINGILVQLPLPQHIDETKVICAIDSTKDVDGFHPLSVGKMLLGQKCFLPCTPHGIVQLLVRSGVKLAGSNTVIIGRSNIVGKPLACMLTQKKINATVTVCHTGTKDIGALTREADIIVVAAGRPNTLTADMIKEGSVVVDVGTNRVEDASRERGYRLTGDVDFENVSKKASLITPVPGGVGPMTITMLLYNTVESAELAAQRDGRKK